MLNPALQLASNSATDALREAVMALQRAHIDTASLDARILLQHVLNVSREEWLAGSEQKLTEAQAAYFRELIEKRARRQPVAQLIGRREFFGREFKVTADTLDPRPDSETLIEAALAHYRDWEAPKMLLDLGTGTGCLLLTLLAEFPQACGVGIDKSAAALNVAAVNAAALGMQERVTWMQGDWGQALMGAFDVIVSNPPYIPTAAIALLAPEVREYEPRGALDGGADGLECYRSLLPQIKRLLAADGLTALEMGIGQAEALTGLTAEHGLRAVAVKDDLAGIARCILLKH